MILGKEYWVSNKAVLTGLKGTGKTYLAQQIALLFNTAVYSPHPNEWEKLPHLYYKPTYFIGEFPLWCELVKRWAIANKINMAIVDEADLLFVSHFMKSTFLKDLIINHRHYGKEGLALIFCTKRPQNLPTELYGECEILCLFSVDSPQAIELFERYHEGLGDMVRQIPYGSHQFVLKHIGQEPRMMRA